MSVVRAILNFLYEVFLGCSHQHLTRPFTMQHQTYMVCLDCGKHIHYSIEKMRTLTMREVRRMQAANGGGVRIMPTSVPVPRLVPARERKSGAA